MTPIKNKEVKMYKIVDFRDEIDTALRVKVDEKYIPQLKRIVKKVQQIEDYTEWELRKEIEKNKIPVEYIPLETDKYIYF